MDARRAAELERLRRGIALGEFFAMDAAAMERAVELLLADDRGVTPFSVLHFLEELDRRATKRHAQQVEEYAKRLDRLTKWLVGLTVALVVLTVALIVLELGIVSTGR